MLGLHCFIFDPGNIVKKRDRLGSRVVGGGLSELLDRDLGIGVLFDGDLVIIDSVKELPEVVVL